MTQIRKIVAAGVLVLSFVTISSAGTITGSRTGTSESRGGTITGSRVGTITGSRTGTITGSRVGTITGSSLGSSRAIFDSIHDEFLFRLMSVVLNGGW